MSEVLAYLVGGVGVAGWAWALSRCPAAPPRVEVPALWRPPLGLPSGGALPRVGEVPVQVWVIPDRPALPSRRGGDAE